MLAIQNMFSKRLLLLISAPIILFLVFLAILWAMYPATSPFTTLSDYQEALTHPHNHMQQEVIGFLPYWRLRDISYIRFPVLSQLIYFSLTADGSGNFLKQTGNQTDPGWLHWNSQQVADLITKTHITGNMFTLTISMLKNKDIESLLSNKNAQKLLIQNIAQQISSKHLDGINLDIEYLGDSGTSTKNEMTAFLTTYTTTLRKQFPHTQLSIDFLPTAARDKGIFNFPAIASLFDRYVIMSYDYYAASSDAAGPIAPMQGFAQGKYFFDVTTTYNDYKKIVPKEKIVMGIPYYGWDWPVADAQKIPAKTLDQNDTNGYPAILSYGRMKQDTDLHPNQCFWDALAASPWCWYTDKGGIQHQVWFENKKSIQTKFAYAASENFAGVALWTVGFDKQYNDLWNIISSLFTAQK